jgi:hypothetical protein
LAPGTYLVQDLTEGTEHYVKFEEKLGSGCIERGKVQCTVEPLEKKSPRTKYRMSSEGGKKQLIRLQIKGENAALVF